MLIIMYQMLVLSVQLVTRDMPMTPGTCNLSTWSMYSWNHMASLRSGNWAYTDGPNHQKMQQFLWTCSSACGWCMAHQALLCQIDISLGRLSNCTWKRPTGHPRSKWVDQIGSSFMSAVHSWSQHLLVN